MSETKLSTGTPLADLLPTDFLIGELKKPAVMTMGQLIFLGRENLRYLRQKWQELSNPAQDLLKPLQERAKLLEGKTVDDLRRLATEYDCPDYPTMMSSYLYLGDFLDTEDPDAEQRQPGTTTLNICGWCKYALGEGYPLHARITGGKRWFRPSCGFFAAQWEGEYAHNFNQLCLLTHCDDVGLNQIRAGFQRVYEYYRNLCDGVEKRVQLLYEMIEKAESKPVFPACRASGHYVEGDTIYFFKHKDSPERSDSPYPFNHCHIKSEYEVVRGAIEECINYNNLTPSVSFRPFGGSDDEVRFLDCTDERLISFEELAYLAHHPEYAQIWLSSTNESQGVLAYMLNFYQEKRYIPTRLMT